MLKHLAAGLGGGFLASLGIDLPPIIEALPADLPVLEVRVEQPDALFRTASGTILHFEFQMTSDAGDLRRFYRYNYAASEYYDADVHTVVFYGPRILEAPDTLRRGSITYVVHTVFVGQQDGDAVLAEVRAKLALGEILGDADLTKLKLLPLMALRRPLPGVMADATALAQALSPALRDQVIGTMLGLAYNYLGQDIVDQLLRETGMANALQKLVEDALVRGQAEGKAEGKAEGRAEGLAQGQAAGELKGRHDDILSVLETRFGPVPESARRQVVAKIDPASLRALVIAAATVASLDAFAKALEESTAP